MPLKKIISGGQTGVDRAALDAAREVGLSIGGWCPRGRRAEDGPIPETYPLVETPSEAYGQRTAWNVRDSDATLVLVVGEPEGGTALTIREAVRQGKPHYVHRLGDPPSGTVQRWLNGQAGPVLNVAGPRESEAPGVYEAVRAFLRAIWAAP